MSRTASVREIRGMEIASKKPALWIYWGAKKFHSSE
jgi:hypothetical protein